MTTTRMAVLTTILLLSVPLAACSPSPGASKATPSVTTQATQAAAPLVARVPSATPVPFPTRAPTSTRAATGLMLPPTYTPLPGQEPTATTTASPTAAPTSTAAPTKAATKAATARPAVTKAPGSASASTAAPPPPAPGAASGRIAFTRGKGNSSDVAVLDLKTGAVSTAIDDGRQPDLRFDGQIVFKGTGGRASNLFILKPDGSGVMQATQAAEDRYPQWAPTKNGIIFSSTAGGEERIHIQLGTGASQDNTEVWLKARGGLLPILATSPVWIDNQRIAFAGCDTWAVGSHCGLWTMYGDRRMDFVPWQLTVDSNDRPSDVFNNNVLFSSAASGNWEVYSIWSGLPSKKNVPMPTAQNLSAAPGAQDVGGTFSPDGTLVAFMSNRAGGWGIWIAPAGGGNPRQVLSVPEGFGPHWEEERLSWDK